MKKLPLLASLAVMNICTLGTAQAQFKLGTLMVGTTVGTTAYSNANSDYGFDNGSARTTSTHTYTFSAGPQIGVFVMPRLVAGGTFSLNYSNTSVNTNNTSSEMVLTGSKSSTNNLTIGVGPFLRYYLSNLAAKNWFYAQINGAVSTGTGNSTGSAVNTNTTNTSSGKVSGIFNWNTGASLGVTHFFYNRIGMDFALGYNYAHQKSTNDNTTYTTNDNTKIVTPSANNYLLATGTNGLTASVGFHFFL